MEWTRQFGPARLLAAALAIAAWTTQAHDAPRVGFQVRDYTLSNLVGGNDVRAIARTADGYLWAGTPNDLYRFNGERFVSATELLGIRRLRVETLHAIGNTVWVGTAGRGVFRIEGGTVTQFDADDGLANDVVWDIAGTAASGLYIATSEGVSHLTANGLETVPGFDGLVSGIARDRAGGLWAHFGDGSLKRSSGQDAIEVAIDDALVYAVHARPDGAIWLATDRGLLTARSPGAPFQSVPEFEGAIVTRLASAATDDAWLTTFEGRAWQWRDGLWQHRHITERLPDTRIRTLLADPQSGVWIGTANGLAQVLGGDVIALGPEFVEAEVWAVTRTADGQLWMATGGTGISRLNPRAVTLSAPLEGLPSNDIWALAPSVGGGLWAGSGDAGAFEVRDAAVVRHVTDLPVPQVWSIAESEDGTLLIGTDGGGLVRLRGDERRVFDKQGGLAGDRVWALLPISPDRYWVGTNNGLCLLDGDDLSCFNRSHGLPGNAVWAVAPIAGGGFWVSTDEGLARADVNGRIMPVTREPLASANVFGTQMDARGNLWVLSAEGLHRVVQRDLARLTTPADDTAVIGRTYGPADGLTQTLLTGASPAMATDSDGGLWLATSGGLVLVQTDAIGDAPLDARLRLEAVYADGQSQDLVPGVLRLPAGTRLVNVDYASLSLRFPEQTKVVHRLLGDDDRWSAPTLDRRLAFANLLPGQYELEIRLAPNALGLYSEPLRMGFELLPLWHERLDIRLLLLGVGVLTLLGVYQWRMLAATASHRERESAARRELMAAQRVAESERRYRDIFSSVTELVVLVDAHDRILEANPAATRLVPACKKGARLHDVLPRPTDEATWRLELAASDGQRHTLDLRATPRHDGSQLVVGRDVTDELALQARSAATQRLEAIGKLTAGVAHDFNNLLTVIMGNAAMLADADAPEVQRARVHAVLDAANRAADITGKLLSIGRRQTVRPHRIDLNEHLTNMKSLLGRIIEENIQVRFDLRGSPVVKIDTGLLQQIILNLVINARDAIEGQGEIRIESRPVMLTRDFIASHPGLHVGPHARITISDTGCGMDARTVEKAFEPFFTTKGAGEGSGLGLATVYGAVKQCDGSIFISSEAGKGTRIDIYLPASELPAEQAVQKPDAPKPSSLGHRILVVEDNPQILSLLDTVLTAQGHAVTAVDSARAALAAYGPDRFDLIVSDVVLTDGTGPQLIARIAGNRPRPPVLFISGYAHDHLAGLEGDDVDILEKPFSIDDLLNRTAALLTNASAAAPARRGQDAGR